MMNTTLFGMIIYILLQLLIGIAVSRRITNESDYLLAGRSLGSTLATLSVFATWFGAETCIGAAGSVYERGMVGASVDPFGYALCLVLMGLLFSIPLWRRQLTTLADLFRVRYSSTVEGLAVLLMVPGTVMWAAAQIRAFGHVLSATSGYDVEWTIAIAALVVIFYTMYGGLLADVVTDAVQGVALIIGLCILLFCVVKANGGLLPAINHIEPRRLQLFGSSEQSWIEIIEQWAIPVCGSLMSQELVSRVLASRSPEIARRACVNGGLLYLTVGMMPVAIGLMGYHLVPGLKQPEQILPHLAGQYLNALLYIIFAGALISAILSTVDSALLAASALLSHNLLIPRVHPVSETDKVKIARYVVMFCGIIAYGLALHAGRVYTLVEEASAFGSAGIFVVVIFGLFTRFGRVGSAAGALIAGISSWIIGQYGLHLTAPYLTSLAAALSTYVIIALLETRRHNVRNG